MKKKLLLFITSIAFCLSAYEGLAQTLYDNLPAAGSGNGFVTSGSRWNKCNITYFFLNGTPDMAGTTEKTSVINAFNVWTTVMDVRFTEAASASAADILLSWGEIDGPSNTLAQAYYPPIGDILFDEAETWVDADLSAGGAATKDIVSVAIHEIGHALGLAHSADPNAIMYPTYSARRTLYQDDINAIRSIYPYVINGPASLCSGSTNYSYLSTDASSSYPAMAITWTATGGLQIIAGQNSPTVTVQKVGTAVTGQLCATAGNTCTRCVTVTTNIPGDGYVASFPVVSATPTAGKKYVTFSFPSNCNWSCGKSEWNGAGYFSEQGNTAITKTYILSNLQKVFISTHPFNACGSSPNTSETCCRAWQMVNGSLVEYELARVITDTDDSSIEAIKNGIVVYPNPASEQIHVKISSVEERTYTLKLLNILGETIVSNSKTINAGSETTLLNIAAVPNGVYVLTIDNGAEIQKQKVIVNH